MSEPNLDLPGTPIVWDDQEIPRTKRQNCSDAAYEAGGLDHVTDEILSRWKVSKQEYATFVADHLEARQALERDHRFHEIVLSQFPGLEPAREEKIYAFASSLMEAYGFTDPTALTQEWRHIVETLEAGEQIDYDALRARADQQR